MDSLNSAETGDQEQASTVPPEPDPWTPETDPPTDGGTQGGSQSSLTAPTTFPFLNNEADEVENVINLSEFKPPFPEPKQHVILEPFSTPNTDTTFTVTDGTTEENENNDTMITLLEVDKGGPSDDHSAPSLKIPKENGTELGQCFCGILRPKELSGGQGEPELKEKSGIQGLEAPKGVLGLDGRQGEKGYQGLTGGVGGQGPPGQKGESGDPCTACPKGERGDKGEPGYNGTAGPPGFVGEKGADGNPGLKGENGIVGKPGQKGSKGLKGDKGDLGEVGPKGSKGALGHLGPAGPRGNPGIHGKIGYPGHYGPPGVPGRKGEKGQCGDCTEQEHVAFSVGLQRLKSFPLPGSPVQFEKVFLNLNNGYNTKSGIFTASFEGVYFFSFHLSVMSKPLKVALFHNGKSVVQILTKQNDNHVSQASGSLLIQLEEDDEIYLQVLNASQNGLVADANTDSLFSGVLLFPIPD
ncbi:hypothetical protein NDU88_001136 [Pleurodeles waltl]|uniref:C1q domain-containing protein n=1 Tax=Pleurodeles waltl TaxID=8319 RepID=A0AAV7LC79_PLEWA|nr:hypothetical protein NDU88_001136 [Pleurodeles waltl]